MIFKKEFGLLLFAGLGNDVLRHIWRDIGIVVKLHTGAGTTLGGAAQAGCIAEHFAQRHKSGNFFNTRG
jgi:hypothetical protein